MSSNSVESPVEASDAASTAHTASSHSSHDRLRTFSPKVRLGGYSLAVVSVLLAFLLRFLLDPWLGDQSPYVVFVVAVAITGLYAGVRPAWLATALGAVVAYFCFVPPRYRWGFAGISDAVGFGVYLLAAIAVVLLTHAHIRAAAKAEQSLKTQVEAERRLVDAETLFRHFMDHSSACAYLRDEEGRCVYANEAARREFDIETERLPSGEQVTTASDFREQDRQVLNSGQAMEFVDRGEGPVERYWLTSKFPFVDQSGRKFVGGISLEITDRMRAEEILRKAERLSAAGHMASLLAHEINNPLAALTNLMFLLDQQPLASPGREYVSEASDALNRINRIAAMTMGFYFDQDALEPLHICRIADEVAEVLATTESFKHIHVVREFEYDGLVVASPPRIRQLIVSLLTNAMESGAQTVRMRVSMGQKWRRPRRKGVRITIADDGCGIQPELRARIFEPFFSTKSEKGTGLGLWGSRAVVLRKDGTLKLRSAVTGPRKGTCVSVFLPTPAVARVLNVNSKAAVGTGNLIVPESPLPYVVDSELRT
jgi:signal transduction histidine kinase